MRDFQRLRIWQTANELAKEVYAVVRTLSRSDRDGIGEQMRRAAVSVPSNIAEGAGRGTEAEFARFLGIALGSLSELEAQLTLAAELAIGDSEVLRRLADRARRLRFATWTLQRRLRHSPR